MPQSTPITELQGNPDPAANASSAPPTKPLVQDILKEIQQESGANTPQGNLEGTVPTQTQPSEHPMEVPPNMTETANGDYVNQQEQALQYQIDPAVQPQAEGAIASVEAVHDPTVVQGTAMQMDDLSLDYASKPTSTTQRVLEHLKDPLLVVLLSILLSVPVVSQFIFTHVSKIPGGSNQMVPILVRAIMAGVLFYVLRRFV